MTTTETLQKLRQTADECGGLVRQYSGRGMMGSYCYAIDCDDQVACIESAAANGLRGAKVDTMGKGYIVYWPHIKD